MFKFHRHLFYETDSIKQTSVQNTDGCIYIYYIYNRKEKRGANRISEWFYCPSILSIVTIYL